MTAAEYNDTFPTTVSYFDVYAVGTLRKCTVPKTAGCKGSLQAVKSPLDCCSLQGMANYGPTKDFWVRTVVPGAHTTCNARESKSARRANGYSQLRVLTAGLMVNVLQTSAAGVASLVSLVQMACALQSRGVHAPIVRIVLPDVQESRLVVVREDATSIAITIRSLLVRTIGHRPCPFSHSYLIQLTL